MERFIQTTSTHTHTYFLAARFQRTAEGHTRSAWVHTSTTPSTTTKLAVRIRFYPIWRVYTERDRVCVWICDEDLVGGISPEKVFAWLTMMMMRYALMAVWHSHTHTYTICRVPCRLSHDIYLGMFVVGLEAKAAREQTQTHESRVVSPFAIASGLARTLFIVTATTLLAAP